MTSKRWLPLAVFAVMTLTTVTVLGQSQFGWVMPLDSPAASISQTIGVTEITLKYHRPAVKGRKIWGGLEPYDKVWRAGANDATTISFSTAVKIEGQPLPAGTYALFMIPTPNEWTVIFNKTAKQWGAFNYKEADDVLRIKVAPQAAEHQEELQYSFPTANNDAATLVFHWEKVKLALRIAADTPALTQGQFLSPAQAALVAAERAFAKLGAERGVRESFLTWFADEAIAFYPQPMRAKDKLSKDPVEPLPLSYRLNWAPVYGDIARAGDLGYNLGPIRVDDLSPEKKPPQHAVFFSVWKKQANGEWRVVLDLGVGVPAPVAALEAPFKAAPRVLGQKPPTNINVEKERLGLLEIEKAYLAESAKGLPSALQKYADEAIRVHRPGLMPVIGKQALQSWLAAPQQAGLTVTGQPIFADVSRSGDLAYSYGSCELGGTLTRKGYFGRVWRRDAAWQWRIAVDVLSLLPAEKPQTSQSNQ